MTRRSLAAAVLVLVAAAPVAAGEPTDRLRTFIERANRVILAPEADGGLDESWVKVRDYLGRALPLLKGSGEAGRLAEDGAALLERLTRRTP